MKVSTNYQQNSPAFQMNIRCKKDARRLLQEELKAFSKNPPEIRNNYFESKNFSFKRIFSDFQQRFEEITKDIDGTVTIIKHEDSNPLFRDSNVFRIVYTPPNGKPLIGSNEYFSHDILPDRLNDRKQPSSYTIKNILCDLADLLSRNGVEKKDNKILALYEKLNEAKSKK